MFQKILIANRGEIACRVIRTAHRLGIATVAVYSDADRHALHVERATEAHPIGPAPARQSYLDTARILQAAHASGADAIHPGYGFLSENADFAHACADAGLVFIGPSPAAIRAMGSKSAAKSLMERAGVPLVPGYHGDAQDRLADEATRIGYPVLIKASAGGGGKGMRVVEREADFPELLAAAQGEALAAFGDHRILLERYLTRPRHIEIQVFADRHGNVVHLFERDCSIQRRHQKVVEEAPAPGLTQARRAEMGQAACNAARAIGYEGAGTVEFIVENDEFFFMEMNTRLQVEHPVTEMITGQDLVEWQLRVAAGEPLPLRQPDLAIDGHAIEVRLYAEDPARDYLPSIGRLTHLRFPSRPHLRIDAGVQQGDAISVHYDPMIAKLIGWGPTRADAIHCLRDALGEVEIAGVRTNLALLRAIAGDPDFGAAALDTGFLARHPALATAGATASPAAIAAAAAAFLTHRADAARRAATDRADPHSPWASTTGWRLHGDGAIAWQLQAGADLHQVVLQPRTHGAFTLERDGTAILVEPGDAGVMIDGVRHRVTTALVGDDVWAFQDGAAIAFRLVDPLAPPASAGAAEQRLLAPMPGRIVAVQTDIGATVAKGDVLVVLEAMKVQMRLAAPRDGIVAALHARPGDLVDEGVELVAFE